jgi:hypothetical protein
MLSQLKGERSVAWDLKLMGVPSRSIHEVGTTDGLRALFGISATDIIRAIESAGGGI